MDIFNGKDAIIKVPLADGEEFLSLGDDDTFVYSLYDLGGNIVEGIENKSIDPSDLDDRTMIYVKIPGIANHIETGKTFSNRILTINYTIGGTQRNERISYRIIPFVPYTCNNDDVRNILGVHSTVIEDNAIDIYSGYLKCKSLFEDSSALDSYLTSGSLKSVLANKAIIICSALAFRSSLSLLTPKIETDSVTSQTRFTMSKDDFDKIFDDLEDDLSEILSELTDENVQESYAPDLFVVGNLTDTFTGG